MTQLKKSDFETATFGAGCFWGIEETFRRLRGVISTEAGYAGGHKKNPSYEEVCSSETGHAEVVQIKYDPHEVSYAELLMVFWTCHDPTTLNRQGPDIGEQYRSVIFFHSPEQEKAARKSKEILEKARKFKHPIVTQILPAGPFYQAEDYHQKYLAKRGLGSCHL